jgi:hypothetical protein
MSNTPKKRLMNLLIFVGCLVILLVITLISYPKNTVEAPPDTKQETEELSEVAEDPNLIADPILFPEVTYVQYYSVEECTALLSTMQDCLAVLDNTDITLYTKSAISAMSHERDRLLWHSSELEADINRYSIWEKEYYYAAKVWAYFKKLGFSDDVTAGIIGNMMVETGGGTLNLKPTIYSASGSYYGLCQWSLYYSPHMANTSFEAQLDYLITDLPVQFKTFGKLYKSGFTYDKFLALDTPADAALAFAKVYERCASGSYGLRQEAARNAYDYFANSY